MAAALGRKHAVISDPEERICNHVRAMYAIQHFDQPGSRVTLQGLMIAVLGELATASRGGGSGTPEDPWRVAPPDRKVSGQENLLMLVDSAIQSNLDDNLSLDELAERLQMSASSLVHRFKAETGMSIVQRRRWLKIREARRLLALPGATVKTVAQRLNFSSPFYFSKVFSELVGMPPQDYMLKSRRR